MKGQLFAGTGLLTHFILRKDRLRLAVWILGLAAFFAVLVPVMKEMFATPEDNAVMSTMMTNPAMVAIVGPVYGIDNYTTGAAYANMMFLFSAMLAGVMSIFIVTHNTRQDEELGRLEVIRSLPVGRLANLLGTLNVVLIANLILIVLTTIGLAVFQEEGMGFGACLLFALGCGVIGLFFAALTAIFCQLTANNRTATSLSFLALMVLYCLRAAGDIGEEALALISPLGLVLRTEVFVENNWWPLPVILLISLVCTGLAFALARMRDLGRGLLPERPGRRHGSFLMSSPLGLNTKLLRSSFIIWALVIFICAAMYASIFGDLDNFLGSNEMLKMIFAADPEFSLAEQFIVLLVAVMTMIATVPVLLTVNRGASEEKLGHAEHLWTKAVSRESYLAAFLIPALVMILLFQLLIALGFWSVGSQVLSTLPGLDVFMQACLAYIPAELVMVGLALVIIAYLPGKSGISYLYLGYTFMSVYLGSIADLPDWTRQLTPFGHVPQYPVEEMEILPLAVMTGIAALLFILAFVGYRRRDMKIG